MLPRIARISAVTMFWLLLLLNRSAFALSNTQIWFAPEGEKLNPDGKTVENPSRYGDLFSSDAQWKTVSSHVNVFKFYPSYFEHHSIQELAITFKFLKEHHIAMAMEFAIMNRAKLTCGEGVEGFTGGGPGLGKGLLEKIKSAGGTLDYIAMDEPVWYGHIFHSKNSCDLRPREMASNAAETVTALRAIFPNLQFGDTEPVADVAQQDVIAEYASWIDAWKEAVGTPMAFFHADVDWHKSPNEKLRRLGAMLASKNVPFGIIYNSDNTEGPNDTAWLEQAKRHFMEYENGSQFLPQQAVFQSWNPHPDKLLPETDPAAHTHLILEYLKHHGSA